MITRPVFENHLNCRYKGYLHQGPGAGRSKTNEYTDLVRRLDEEYRAKTQLALFPDYSLNQVRGASDTLALMASGATSIMNGTFSSDGLDVVVDALEKNSGKSSCGSHYYQPVLFTRKPAKSTHDKLVLGFFGFVLSKMQDRIPEYGTIISGNHHKRQRIRLPKLINRVRKEIEVLIAQNKEPRVFLNSHCKQCEYQQFCHQKAKERDDLSLLSKMNIKEAESLSRRGIFTVTQLSYLFRPKRLHKDSKSKKRPHSFPLQALAIRENKIHLYNHKVLPKVNVNLFLDVESDQQLDFYYLIGLHLFSDKGTEKVVQLWADCPSEEGRIFLEFLDFCGSLSDYKIFHYGNYERNFIKAMANRLGLRDDKRIEKIQQQLVNVVDFIYASVYFPTYSNDLKSIASFLGYRWKHINSSGLQSVVWRKNWDAHKSTENKQVILDYNADDLAALRLVVEVLLEIGNSNTATLRPNIVVANAETITNKPTYRWGKKTFVLPEMKEINLRSYYDYQKDRVYIRGPGAKAKTKFFTKAKRAHQYNKINKTLYYRCDRCSNCDSTEILKNDRRIRRIVDLKASAYGIKKWIVKCVAWAYRCNVCKHKFISELYRPAKENKLRAKYGQSLLGWVIYQHIANNQSFGVIEKNLKEVFGININRGTLHGFKEEAYELYKETYEQLKQEVLNSKVLVIDEATLRLNDINGYAWVFANTNVVLFVFKETREGDFLQEFLRGFTGVIVSDFYSAYDSISCPQQKCLIHLIRDLNDDVTKNPFDEELKAIAGDFTALLRSLVATVDEFGLKKRSLIKHKPEVDNFFQKLQDGVCSSENAMKYQKRFLKNRDKLFTFINYNDVPWNSNAAEHAIKYLSRIRKSGMTSFTKDRINAYMALISLYQTCEYRDASFLRFLLSGEKKLG